MIHKKMFLRKLCTLPLLEPEYKLMRDRFLKMEAIRESIVDFDQLTNDEIEIYEAHKNAVNNWHFTYDDPFDGCKNYTTYRHTLLERCCGTACRHCIFNHRNVPDLLKKNRKFNTAFWTLRDINKKNPIELFRDLKVKDEVIKKKIF